MSDDGIDGGDLSRLNPVWDIVVNTTVDATCVAKSNPASKVYTAMKNVAAAVNRHSRLLLASAVCCRM